MTNTPRFDSIAADGTGPTLQRIHLADGRGIAVRTRPGADTISEVFVSPGVVALTGAQKTDSSLDAWLTRGRLVERQRYMDVPVEAVRALIAQHGGEHADQGPEWTIPHPDDLPSPSEGQQDETAQAAVTRALAQWGITAHPDDESMIGGDRNSWLVIGHAQSGQTFPDMNAEPYIVLYIYNEEEDEITVDRAPRPGDDWYLAVGDGTGREHSLPPRPADQLGACIEDIAEWVTAPRASLEALVDLQDLRGRFEDGYSPENIRSTFGRIHEAGGPYLVCVWDYADEYGFGGTSQFYAEDENGNLSEVQPEIYQWLSGECAMPVPLDAWTCAPVAEPIEIAASDDFHNYAQADKTS